MSGSESRAQAVFQVTNSEPMSVKKPKPLDKIWATDVFTLVKMEEALSSKAFKAVKKTVETGGALDAGTADVVAAAMKDWAMSKGANYFSHVFYPMTGASAEKHDGFIVSDASGKAITEFTGSLLIKGEPDGSSFPNGSIRVTNAARGYTAWDPTSPAYIMQTDNGATLCIPCIFISWSGESLDKKVPLLRSNSAMNDAAQKVLKLMGEKEVGTLNSSCGAEQEYFLVDANFANLRPDLLLAGRTLFGAPPAKGQEFDDHYFGAIPPRVQVFMQDVEDRLYRLGIPAKTKHNEVAPGQFEIAPYFEAANVAADHQQLLMTVLKNTAKKHGFICLLHEKPFAGINGSGKHVNWSVGNKTQGNLLDPGTTPHSNLNFLLFCGAVIRGVNLFGPLLRAVIATAGNDEGGLMDMGLSQIMPFAKDAGDRNRTSPFAFTGNRFEFRAVGSDQSVTGPLIAMNTILADSLNWIAGELEKALKKNSDTTAATISVLKKLMKENGQAVFGGDGYSSEWHKEAVKRGLKNLPTTADALPYLRDKDIQKLFSSTGVLSPVELESRFEVYSEQYILTIEVEAKLVINMAKTAVYPAATRYLTDLAMAATAASEMGVDIDNSVAKDVAKNTKGMMAAVAKLEKALAKDNHKSEEDHMQFCAQEIRGLMDSARTHVDALEGVIADDMWPLPTYQEMLYIK